MDRKNVVCIHTYANTTEYYSAIKRKETGSFADTWTGLETVLQSEVSQNEKTINTYMWNL